MAEGLYFSIGSIGFKQKGVLIGYAEIPGELKVDLKTPLMKTEGGASQFAVAARTGRASGDISFSLNQRPAFIDEYLQRGIVKPTPASAAVVATVNDVKGSMSTKITMAASTGKNGVAGLFVVEATAADEAIVKVISNRGAFEVPTGTITANDAIEIPGTNMEITFSSIALTPGDIVEVEVTPVHGGVTRIELPSIREAYEFEVIAFTSVSAQGGDDAIEELRFPRVMFDGAEFAAKDNEPVEGVELAGTLLTPTGGKPVFIRRIIKPA